MLEYARWKYCWSRSSWWCRCCSRCRMCSATSARCRSRARIARPSMRHSSPHRIGAKQHGVTYNSAALEDGNAIVRFDTDTEQLKARDVVKDEKTGLAKDYVNAMMYASRAPRWMQAFGLRAMPLGLDLRGGLYLLYQVDVDGAVEKLLESYDQDFRRALRTEKIPFTDVNTLTVDSDIPNGLRVLLPAGADTAQGARRAQEGAAGPRVPRCGGRRGTAVDCVLTAAAGARAPRLRHHLQHHHAAQPRQRRSACPSPSCSARASIASSCSCPACRTPPRSRTSSARSPRSSIAWSTRGPFRPAAARPSAPRSTTTSSAARSSAR